MSGRVADQVAVDNSLGTLLNELTDGSAQLVRDEIRLAKVETMESLRTLRGGAVMLGIAVGLGLCASAAALAGLIMVIARYLLDGNTWLAAFIVAVVLGIVAVICGWRGSKALSGAKLAPHETTTSIKETAAWLKHPKTSAAR